MYCRKCGTEIPDDSVFCVKCGAPVEAAAEKPKTEEQAPMKTETAIPVYIPPKKEKKTGLIIACIAVGLALAFAGLYFFVLKGGENADANATPIIEEKPVSILENKEKLGEITASVLKIECYDISGEVYATGSGFVAFSDDLIVTNFHVIEDHPFTIKALAENGSTFTIDKIMVYNQEMDIAILKTTGNTNLAPLTFAEENVEKTDTVVAIGSPLGLMNTVSDGIVSGFTQVGNESVIQFTASISHGSSGGVLLNEAGEVVGVTFASFSEGQNLNVAIPIEYVDALYNQASPEKAVTVKQFFDAVDHIYTLSYILENSEDFMGKTVTFQAYVSSLYTFGANGQSPVQIFLVEKESDVLGYLGNADYKDPAITIDDISKTTKMMRIESDKVKELQAMEVWIYQYETNQKLLPGSFITISGKLAYMKDRFPDITNDSSSSNTLTVLEWKITY